MTAAHGSDRIRSDDPSACCVSFSAATASLPPSSQAPRPKGANSVPKLLQERIGLRFAASSSKSCSVTRPPRSPLDPPRDFPSSQAAANAAPKKEKLFRPLQPGQYHPVSVCLSVAVRVSVCVLRREGIVSRKLGINTPA